MYLQYGRGVFGLSIPLTHLYHQSIAALSIPSFYVLASTAAVAVAVVKRSMCCYMTGAERTIDVFNRITTTNVWEIHACSMQLEVLVSSHEADAALSTFQYGIYNIQSRRSRRKKGTLCMRVGSGTYKIFK
jgi:hypothetical protein